MCCFGQVLVGTVLDAADNKMLKDVEMEVPNSVETLMQQNMMMACNNKNMHNLIHKVEDVGQRVVGITLIK